MTSEEKQEGLWRNCEDSIRHASVAHAAEVYGNLLLCVFNPKHPERADGHYPPLDGVRKMRKDHTRLTESERYVFDDVFAGVADQRNTLMHMPAPEVPVVKDAAKALLALLHIVRRRTGLPTKEFFGQDPPVEQDIFKHIGWRDHDDWFRVAEKLALSEYGGDYLKGCNYCNSFAGPPDGPCQACFHERQGL